MVDFVVRCGAVHGRAVVPQDGVPLAPFVAVGELFGEGHDLGQQRARFVVGHAYNPHALFVADVDAFPAGFRMAANQRMNDIGQCGLLGLSQRRAMGVVDRPRTDPADHHPFALGRLLQMGGKVVVNRVHIDELGIAALGRGFLAIKQRCLGRKLLPVKIGVPVPPAVLGSDRPAVLVLDVRQAEHFRVLLQKEILLDVNVERAEIHAEQLLVFDRPLLIAKNQDAPFDPTAIDLCQFGFAQRLAEIGAQHLIADQIA